MKPVSEEERVDTLTIRTVTGKTQLVDVVHWVFYMRRSNLLLREAAALAIERVVMLFQNACSLEYMDFEGYQQPLDASALREVLDTRLLGPMRAPNANVVIESVGDPVPEFHLWFNGKVVDVRSDPEASYLHLWTPTGWFFEHREQAMALFSFLVANLPITAAYLARGPAGPDWRRKQALIQRYWNIDIADPLCVSADIGDRVPGAYWTTVLGGELASRLDPTSKALASLNAAGCHRITEQGAHVFSLEDQPCLGDRNRGESAAPGYGQLAALLEQSGLFHVPDRVAYFFDENGMADRDQMAAWHRRYLQT